MALAAFKMSYAFEGHHSTKPEQNLSGASKKMSRDALLHKMHQERRKRQDQRLRLQSALVIQSYIRSYLVRKRIQELQRIAFDKEYDSATMEQSLSSLLFFYDPKQDNERLMALSKKLLTHNIHFPHYIERDVRVTCLIRRWLVLCLKASHIPDTSAAMLECLNVFANGIQTIEYVIQKGYYTQLRILLDNNPDQVNQILHLIHRPFHYLYDSQRTQDIIMARFVADFIRPEISSRIKTDLIPYLRSKKDFPFHILLKYLQTDAESDNHSELYCILSLEPDNYEATPDLIRLLASKSAKLYTLKRTAQPQATNADQLSDDDSEDEAETSTVSSGELLVSELLHILNKPDRVGRWIHTFENHCRDDDLVVPLSEFCYNLLLVYKDSIRKYLLLYKLGLSGKFLNNLWVHTLKRALVAKIKKLDGPDVETCCKILCVFCHLFIFYTETLTDSESSDTSETFPPDELLSIAKLIKVMGYQLVERAFPVCRWRCFSTTEEKIFEYWSFVNCLRTLHMLDMRKQFCPPGFWTTAIPIPPNITRKNYLAKTIQPYCHIESEDDNFLPALSSMEQRSLAFLQQLPFIIHFNTRFVVLRDLCYYSLGDNEFQRMQTDFLNDGVIVIRRTHLYEDAFDKLSVKNEPDLRHKLRIQFINSAGLEEAGIDGGGIFKEFINEVLKTAFDPNRGFFLMTAENTLYPNPNVHLIVDNFAEHYYFIGRLVGKAIFENILVDLPLAEFFLAKLLVDRSSAHYLQSLDPVLYRNLLYLRDYPGDVSELGLDFTTVNNDLGETKIMDLKPNGRSIQVTNSNRLEYIQRLADLKLNAQLRTQCRAFREGLDNVVSLVWLRLFDHKELQVIIGGDTQAIDLSDLRVHTVYGGDFNPDHPTVILFWRVLDKFTESQKTQLLKFVTSCSRPPLLGFKELNPPFCIQSSGNEDRMPTSSTCLNLLKLPMIKEEEVLRNKLLAAIEQQAGFELS